MAILGVGFDIDGTLYPDHRAHLCSIPFLLSHPRAVFAFSKTRRTMRERSDDAFMGGNPGEIEAEIFAEKLGCGLDEARDIRDRIIYSGWEHSFRNVRPYEGVREALLRIREEGIKLAALSDFPVGRKLSFFGLDGLFDVVLGYPESVRLKPRPEPFLLMAEKLSLAPENIIYVGNRLDYDVRGAENAGMRGALIGPPGRKAPPDVTTYHDYRHLAESILSEVTT